MFEAIFVMIICFVDYTTPTILTIDLVAKLRGLCTAEELYAASVEAKWLHEK